MKNDQPENTIKIHPLEAPRVHIPFFIDGYFSFKNDTMIEVIKDVQHIDGTVSDYKRLEFDLEYDSGLDFEFYVSDQGHGVLVFSGANELQDFLDIASGYRSECDSAQASACQHFDNPQFSDALAVFEASRSYPGVQSIEVNGVSLGALLAMHVAAKRDAQGVIMGVVDGQMDHYTPEERARMGENLVVFDLSGNGTFFNKFLGSWGVDDQPEFIKKIALDIDEPLQETLGDVIGIQRSGFAPLADHHARYFSDQIQKIVHDPNAYPKVIEQIHATGLEFPPKLIDPFEIRKPEDTSSLPADVEKSLDQGYIAPSKTSDDSSAITSDNLTKSPLHLSAVP